jgi:hypothetical protein
MSLENMNPQTGLNLQKKWVFSKNIIGDAVITPKIAAGFPKPAYLSTISFEGHSYTIHQAAWNKTLKCWRKWLRRNCYNGSFS